MGTWDLVQPGPLALPGRPSQAREQLGRHPLRPDRDPLVLRHGREPIGQVPRRGALLEARPRHEQHETGVGAGLPDLHR